MDRVNEILRHGEFRSSLEKTAALEKDRVYCGHGMEHLLDVARIAYCLCLEERQNTGKELIYAAALLHDTGKWRQYEDGTPHEEESARIAARILPECGFTNDETALVLEAIKSHRTKNGEKPGFPGLLYRADKLSRRCFECTVSDCGKKMMNKRLEY